MTSIAALFAAALLAGMSASPSGATPGAVGDVTYHAGKAVWHVDTEAYELSEGVVVRRGGIVIRARTARFTPATGEVEASGDVLLVDATRVVKAEGLHAVLDGPFEATGVVAFFKEKPLEPARIASLADARQGRNSVTASADRVEGDAEDRMTLYGARFTLCDCGPDRAPTWELGSRRAEVEGDRVALSWPVFRVTPRFLFVKRPIPVLVLPWLSLPLRDRQTGLLFPEVGQRGVTGFYFAQPVYVTLGRSADLTATPEYFFGPSNPRRGGGAVKGPGARLELRWAPADRAYGEVVLHLVHDLDEERPGGAGGAGTRASLVGRHAQDLGSSTRLVTQLALSQDPYMFRDFGGAGLPTNAYYSRSDALVSRRGSDWTLEGGAAYFEPLVGGDGAALRPPSFGVFGARAPVLHRWPSVSAALVPIRLGPVQAEGRVGVARYAPLSGHVGRLLPSNPWRPLPAGASALDREAVTRGDARLQLAVPFMVGEGLSLEPFVRGAVNGYGFDEERAAASAAWGIAGISAHSMLARRYGGVEHRVVPRLELLSGTDTWSSGGDPFAAYDLWDRVDPDGTFVQDGQGKVVVQKLSAAPDGAYTQLRLTLENRLDAGSGGSFGLVLGQDADVRRGRLAETSAAVDFTRGPVSAWANARLLAFGGRPALAAGGKRSWLDEFTSLGAGLALHDRRGDSVNASLSATGSGAVGAQGAGIDALFDLRPSLDGPSAGMSFGARAVLGGARLDYQATLSGRDGSSVYCGRTGKSVTRDAGQLSGQAATLVWDSPCQCFGIRVRADLDACDTMSYGVDVDLSKILQGASRVRR